MTALRTSSPFGLVLSALWTAYGWLMSAALPAICIVALWRALRSGSLGKRSLVAALCLWAAFLAAAVALHLMVPRSAVTVPPSAVALGLGMMTLPLTAAAVAPLALASHRHQ